MGQGLGRSGLAARSSGQASQGLMRMVLESSRQDHIPETKYLVGSLGHPHLLAEGERGTDLGCWGRQNIHWQGNEARMLWG